MSKTQLFCSSPYSREFMLCYPCHCNSPSFKSHTVNINASCLQLFLETWLSAFLKGTVVLADAVFMGLELVTGNISISSP